VKQIEVVAAIIRKGDKIFATQRGYGEWQDWWEFPGGKMEVGETPEEALKREIREELSAEISVGELLTTVEYDYPAFHLTMHCFLCTLVGEALHLNEHEAARWLAKDELDSVKWLPADVKVVEHLSREGRRKKEEGRRFRVQG
jgi:8-oxo-dGTP diphosphatase